MAALVVVVALFYNPYSDTMMDYILKPYTELNWDEVQKRNIVENSIPITLLEDLGDNCKVSAHNFDLITQHPFFVRGKEIEWKLNYDKENETLMLPCELLKGEKSRLNVWFVVEESPKHAKKYQYFVTPWNETSSG